MAVITIDQTLFEVDQQKNLLEVAISLGLDVPYFCWHPALGSVGSCRLCAVQQFADENDTVGRTVMACMTPAKDKSCFSVAHPIAKEFRASVVEWLMTNHPHDCPVCDEGGECHLQDMTVLTGHNYRRYRFPKRTYRNQDLGPFVNHEMNRCITCYRCVRYYRDVAGGTDLSAFKSSNRVYFGRFNEGCLESEFSGNLVEICPTGVFTDKTYHQHYVRKWDLATSPSVCQLCAVGCNISLGERGGVLRRIQNRYHHDINGFFICDRGRFGHDFVNSDRRLLKPTIKKENSVVEVSHDEAKVLVKELLAESKNVIGIGSSTASLEANWMLKRLVSPDCFFDGLPAYESLAVNQAVNILAERVIEPATLKDLRESDAVLVIGEDLTNTAPITALCIRQAAIAFKQNTSKEKLDISPWNDAAVRDYARGDMLPVYSLNSFATSLDDIAHENLRLHPMQMPVMLAALRDMLVSNQKPTSFTQVEISWLELVKDGLLKAKKPVVIAGTSLGDPTLLTLAKEIAVALDEKNGHTRLSLILPEVNSVGLSLLKPKNLSSLTSHKMIDVAIVLEQDLSWRLGSKAYQALCQNVKHVVIIDSLKHEMAKSASIALPCQSFLEGSGSVISSEGRLQHFFGATAGDEDIKSSFHILASLIGPEAEAQFTNIDAVDQELAKDLGIAHESLDKIGGADFRVRGQKIPRQSMEVSGRTAVRAHVNIHEQKPLADPDSPFSYSMEGARKKIPLPLVSSSWTPKWNSLQSSFRTILSAEGQQPDAFGGVRLFAKRDKMPFSSIISLGDKKAFKELPYLFVVPRRAIFASFMQAKFSSSMATRMPEVEAEISVSDAKALGFSSFAPIVLETSHGNFSLLAKTKEDVPPGVLVLPFGLVDASLFFSSCVCRVVSKEQV